MRSPPRAADLFFATVLFCRVLAAIGVGPVFTLPLLTNTPSALHAVRILLRFGVGAAPVYPLGFHPSSAWVVAVLASIALVLAPAADRLPVESKMRGRGRWAGIAAALTRCIAALMVPRAGES